MGLWNRLTRSGHIHDDIADRFKRTKFGPHVYYHRERGKFGYGFSAEAFLNKYDNEFENEPEPRGSLDYLDLTHEPTLARLAEAFA